MDCTVQSAIGHEFIGTFNNLDLKITDILIILLESGGFSPMVQLSRTLGIWELKGYDTGTWSVDSCLDTMVSKNSMGDELASPRHAKLPKDINF
jgi:hypothetical protein